MEARPKVMASVGAFGWTKRASSEKMVLSREKIGNQRRERRNKRILIIIFLVFLCFILDGIRQDYT